MSIAAKVLVTLIALQHLYILHMEMFRWTTPRIRKVFSTTEEFANQSKVLAANQGLYNGFLAAGLLWSLFAQSVGTPPFDKQIAIFFVSCVAVAGIYGGLTANKRILYMQAAPALVALAVLLLVPA